MTAVSGYSGACELFSTTSVRNRPARPHLREVSQCQDFDCAEPLGVVPYGNHPDEKNRSHNEIEEIFKEGFDRMVPTEIS